jgi:hypothetical protein
LSIGPAEGVFRTAVHFKKEDDPELASQREVEGQRKGLQTGAFLVAKWVKA